MSEQPEDIVCQGGIGVPGLSIAPPKQEQEEEPDGSIGTGV